MYKCLSTDGKSNYTIQTLDRTILNFYLESGLFILFLFPPIFGFYCIQNKILDGIFRCVLLSFLCFLMHFLHLSYIFRRLLLPKWEDKGTRKMRKMEMTLVEFKMDSYTICYLRNMHFCIFEQTGRFFILYKWNMFCFPSKRINLQYTIYFCLNLFNL